MSKILSSSPARLNGCLSGCLNGCLHGCLNRCLNGPDSCPNGCINSYLDGCLNGCLIGCLNMCLNGYLNGCLGLNGCSLQSVGLAGARQSPQPKSIPRMGREDLQVIRDDASLFDNNVYVWSAIEPFYPPVPFWVQITWN